MTSCNLVCSKKIQHLEPKKKKKKLKEISSNWGTHIIEWSPQINDNGFVIIIFFFVYVDWHRLITWIPPFKLQTHCYFFEKKKKTLMRRSMHPREIRFKNNTTQTGIHLKAYYAWNRNQTSVCAGNNIYKRASGNKTPFSLTSIVNIQ